MAKYTFKHSRLYDGQLYQEVFEFNTPQSPGDEGPEVEILKLYLGIDSIPGETHGTFDTQLQARLRQWQSEYFDDIMAEMPEEQIPEGEARFIANQFTEQGELGDLTFRAMMRKGFASAAKQYLESEHYLLVRKDDVNALFGIRGFPTGNDEVQKPPTIQGNFIEYKYITKYTTRDFQQSSMVLENKEVVRTMFRKAVLEVFDFYNKPKTWNISGAPRPDLPEALNGLYSNAEHLRVEYEKILKTVRRIEETDTFRENQNFTFTVTEQTLQQQIDQSTVEIDVLFGQSMNPGASPQFASIKEISPPGLRPSATYNLVIQVRRDLFEAIEGGQIDLLGRTGGTFDVTNPDTYRQAAKAYGDAKEKAQELWNKAGRVGSILNNPSQVNDQVDKFAKGQARKAAKAAKNLGNNLWDQARTGQGGLSDAERQARAEEATRRASYQPNYGVLEVKLNEFRDILSTVTNKMEEYHSDVETFKEENSKPRENTSRFEKTYNPIIPDINPRDEARKLREVLAGLEEFFQVNGYQFGAGPSDDSKVKINFEPIMQEVFGPSEQTDKSLNPNLDNVDVNPTQTGFMAEIGYKITNITLIDKDGNEDLLTAGVSIFDETRGKRPFIYPTTMGYLSRLDKIEEDVLENPCDDLEEGNPALVFFAKWHYPQPSFNFNKKAASGINIDASITVQSEVDGETKARTVRNIPELKSAAILTAAEEFAEQRALLSDNINAIKESTLFEKRGKVIQTGDVYPEFGKIPCDIEEMWNQFLNQWKMELIMCDLRKCIPQLPAFNIKFDWKLPVLPDIPTFDPMHFVLPQLRISINDIILSFICKFVKNILDTIRKPDCTDLIRFGLAGFAKLQEMAEDDPFANAQERASTFEKAVDTINTMGISGPALDRDSENVLEAVSLALTPTELCDLLQGQATDDVLGIVLRTIQSLTSNLKDYLKTIDQVEKFFTTLGTVVDPFICDRIRELNDIVIAQELCRNDEDLRKLLQDAGATDEQIRSELDALDQKRQLLNDLSKQGDFSSLLPGLSPEEMAKAGLPGPYSNSFQDKMVKLAISSILTNVKSYFDVEMGAFPNKLITENLILIQPGEPGFNGLDYARFLHYSYQLDKISRNPEAKAIKLVGLRLTQFAEPTEAYGLGRPVSPQIILEELGVEEQYRPLVRIFPIDSSGPDMKPDEFAEAVQTYVVGYIEKYGRVHYSVSQNLKNILDSDISTIVRKNPSLKDGYREFNVRLLTTKLEEQPFDVTGISPQSVGTSIGFTELPFSDSNIKDCYRFAYDNPFTNEIVSRNYYSDLPQQYIDMRSDDLDILSDKDRAKLLRPAGFAFYLIQKYTELANGNTGRTTFQTYADSDSNIIPKLQGYLEPVSLDTLREQIFENAESGAERLGAALVYAILGPLVIAQQESVQSVSLYESVVDSINYQISDYTTKSKYFMVENVFEMEESVTSEYRVSRKNGSACYVKNKKMFDFEKLVDGFVKKFREVASKPKHDPSSRDFNEKGPFEEAMIEGLFKLYIDFYCLEIMLKGLFMLSVTGAKDIFKSEMVVDYITDGIVNELGGSLIGANTTAQFEDIVKSITNQDDVKSAIRSMVLKNLDLEEMVNYIEEIFEPKYSSFKERFYNELAENIKEVPSTTDYPTITTIVPRELTIDEYSQNIDDVLDNYTNTRRASSVSEDYAGYRDVLVAPKLPSLYDRFKFEGYSDELIEKKINSGHFWVEKFYRIKDYGTFRRIYNDIERFTRDEPSIGRMVRIDGEYQNYISSKDLERLLFGTELSSDSDRYYQLIEQNEEKRKEVEQLYIDLRDKMLQISNEDDISTRLSLTTEAFEIQEKINNLQDGEGYISGVTFTDTRAGAFNVASNISTARRNRVPVNDRDRTISMLDFDSVLDKQQELYEHIRDNLQVGYRLMFGHKVDRQEDSFSINGEGASQTSTINPEQIFRDLTIDDGTGEIGLSNNTTLFTSKRAFVGHVDKEPLTEASSTAESRESLNSDSAFYLNAIAYLDSINSGFTGRPVYDPSDNGLRLNAELQITSQIKDKMVYSIPVDEVVRDVDCFEDLYSDFEKRRKENIYSVQLQNVIERYDAIVDGTIIMPNSPETEASINNLRSEIEDYEVLNQGFGRPGDELYRPAGQYTNEIETRLAHIDLLEAISTNEELARLTRERERLEFIINVTGQLFTSPLGAGYNTQVTPIKRDFVRYELFNKYKEALEFELLSIERDETNKRRVIKSSDDNDYMKPHRVMFDFLFPMDRYASLHFLQNVEVFDADNGPQGIFAATKLFIIQNMLIYDGLGDTKKDGPLAPGSVDNTKSVMSTSVGGDLPSASEILVMIAKAIASAAADAAAAAVRELANTVDPGYNDMRKGYKKDPCSMKYGLVEGLVGKRNISEYSGDLKNGFGTRNGCKQYVPVTQFPVDLLESTLELDAAGVAKATKHLVGTIRNESWRYGYPFTPMGGYALTVRENKGERHSKLKKDNSCEDGCETKELVTPEGQCEDK